MKFSVDCRKPVGMDRREAARPSPASAALAAAVASASCEISVAVAIASGICEASASAMAPVPVPRSRMRQCAFAPGDFAQEGQDRVDQRLGVGTRLQRLRRQFQPAGRRNRDSRKSGGQARRRAAWPARRRSRATISDPTGRPGALMASLLPSAGKMLDDQARFQRRIVDVGRGEPPARGGQDIGERRRLSLRRRHRQAAATGGRRSARR